MVEFRRKITRFLRYGDRPWNLLITTAAIFVVVLMLSIFGLLWRDSAGAMFVKCRTSQRNKAKSARSGPDVQVPQLDNPVSDLEACLPRKDRYAFA